MLSTSSSQTFLSVTSFSTPTEPNIPPVCIARSKAAASKRMPVHRPRARMRMLTAWFDKTLSDSGYACRERRLDS